MHDVLSFEVLNLNTDMVLDLRCRRIFPTFACGVEGIAVWQSY